jgi:hypothetical protein
MIPPPFEEFAQSGKFEFRATDDLSLACNAPKDAVGVYVIIGVRSGNKEVIYIGSSGKLLNSGELKIRQGGMHDHLVNGKQFDAPRRKSWPGQMNDDAFDSLEVHWAITFDEEFESIPSVVEGEMLQEYFWSMGELPRWNLEV